VAWTATAGLNNFSPNGYGTGKEGFDSGPTSAIGLKQAIAFSVVGGF
jgi:hypothetical protein